MLVLINPINSRYKTAGVIFIWGEWLPCFDEGNLGGEFT